MGVRLLLLRHAKSDWSEPNLSDHDRPLNKRGKRTAPRMGQLLVEQNLVPEWVVSSTAKRAAETARAVLKESGIVQEPILTRRLYLAEPSAYLDVLCEVPPGTQSAMMVGHNPGISELASQLAGQACEMPTAALCVIEFEAAELYQVDSATPSRLVELFKPRELE